MKWVLVGVGFVFVSAALVLLVGAILPRRHLASRAATYRERPDALWATMTDFASAPTWRAGVKQVILADTDKSRGFIEESDFGRVHFEVVEWIAPTRLVTRIADEDLPFGGSWTYEIASIGTSTRVTITENGEIKNPFYRFMSRFVFGQTKTIDDYLRALGKKHGESIVPSAA
jgi:hypothetical protein